MMTSADDWTTAPPSDNDDPFAATHRVQCYCGALIFEVRAGTPSVSTS